jgi:hypothetical protein
MRPLIVFSLALVALAGCASAPPPAVPMEVRVPVPVPCPVSDVQEPAYAVDALPVGAGVWDQMAALRAERLQRKAMQNELAARLVVCKSVDSGK